MGIKWCDHAIFRLFGVKSIKFQWWSQFGTGCDISTVLQLVSLPVTYGKNLNLVWLLCQIVGVVVFMGVWNEWSQQLITKQQLEQSRRLGSAVFGAARIFTDLTESHLCLCRKYPLSCYLERRREIKNGSWGWVWCWVSGCKDIVSETLNILLF